MREACSVEWRGEGSSSVAATGPRDPPPLMASPERLLTETQMVAQQRHEKDGEQEKDQAIFGPHIHQRLAPLSSKAQQGRLPAGLRRGGHDGMAATVGGGAADMRPLHHVFGRVGLITSDQPYAGPFQSLALRPVFPSRAPPF